jgi:hypothetical protein
MNVVNRLFVVFVLLVLIVLTIVVVILPARSLHVASEFTRWTYENADAYTKSQSQWHIFATARVLVGGLIVLLCLVFLWLELRRPRKKTIRALKLAGGEAHIAIDSIAQRLAYNIDQLPEVVDVTPKITGRTRGVDIDLMLVTTPDIDVPMKTEEVLEVTREVIEERMGLKLGKVQVKIKHAPYPSE